MLYDLLEVFIEAIQSKICYYLFSKFTTLQTEKRLMKLSVQ